MLPVKADCGMPASVVFFSITLFFPSPLPSGRHGRLLQMKIFTPQLAQEQRHVNGPFVLPFNLSSAGALVPEQAPIFWLSRIKNCPRLTRFLQSVRRQVQVPSSVSRPIPVSRALSENLHPMRYDGVPFKLFLIYE